MSLTAARGLCAAFMIIVLSGCAAAATPAATAIPPTVPPVSEASPTPSPPAATSELQATSSQTATPDVDANASGQDFTPKQRSVWNTTIGQDQMSGTCAKGSVLPAYGMVQITPGDGGLEWKNQEPKPYALTRAAVNQYVYAGPNSISDGVVTMTVTFVDDKRLKMLRQFTSNSDPGCMHTHEYAGVFQWFR